MQTVTLFPLWIPLACGALKVLGINLPVGLKKRQLLQKQCPRRS